jgi:hypothetical protein
MMTSIKINQTEIQDVFQVMDGTKIIGKIVYRGGYFYPEPHATEWAQDELFFVSQVEAVAFLVGADWMVGAGKPGP